MGAKRKILFFFTALSAINFLTAQEGSGEFDTFNDDSSNEDSSQDSSESHEDRQAGFPFGMNGPGGSLGGFFNGFGWPPGGFFGGQSGGSFGSQPGGQFGQFGQQGDLFGNPSGQPGDLLGGRSRQYHPHVEGQDEPSDRFFFSFPTVRACNYTTQPGRTCISCTQSLRCLSNNVGYLKRCHGLFPYCNNGRCSFFQGALCTATTAQQTTATATQTPTPTAGGTT